MTRRILGVLLAIILAVIGTGAVLLYVYTAKNSVADGQKAVKVLVATRRIPAPPRGKRADGAHAKEYPEGQLTCFLVGLERTFAAPRPVLDHLLGLIPGDKRRKRRDTGESQREDRVQPQCPPAQHQAPRTAVVPRTVRTTGK